MPEINAGNDFLVAAEQLFTQYSDDPQIKSIWQRLSRSTQWQTQGNIINSAGMQFVEVNGWQPENTLLQTRKSLLEPVRQNEHLLFDDKTYVFSMYNLSATKLHLSLRLLDVPFLPEMDAQLYYQLDEETPLQVDLSRQQTDRTLTLSIPKGQHQLRFYLPQPVGNQFIALSFDDHANDLAMQQERAYFVSTVQQPLQVYVQGPAMLRIDEWVNGKSDSHYHAVTKQGWQRLYFPPTGGKTESLFRVKQRTRTASIKQISNRLIKRDLVPVANSQLSPEPLEKESFLHVHDAFQLGKQEQGTWSLAVDLQRRNNIQEDSSLSKPEQFAQYRLEHRFFDQALQAYWSSQGLARVREEGDPTFGVSETLFLQPESWPFQVKLKAKAFVQIVEEEPEWIGQIDFALSKIYQLMKKTSLRPELSVFKRYLSLKNDSRLQDGDDDFKSQLDQDVYSDYKADHTQGLNTALSIRHRPWLDTLWIGRLAAASNEDFNPFNPDYMSLQAQWRQYLDDFQLNAGYRVSFYQNDQDRSTGLSRSQLKLDLNWQNWSVKQNRMELSFQYQYDIEKKAHLPKLSMTIHFGEGRGYRDFRSGELDFLPLMQQRIPHEQNNRIEKNYP